MLSDPVLLDMPLIGIVVPAYQCESYIAATLDSLINQTYTRWECVVVDDGSPDNSWAIANRYSELDPRVRVIRQENLGVAIARNRGIDALSPEVDFITCMDSDDIYLPHALALLCKKLAEDTRVVAVHAIGDFIDEQGNSKQPGVFAALGRGRLTCVGGRVATVPLDQPSTFANIVTASTMYPPGLLLIRRDILTRTGGFDPELVGAEDWDLFIRLSRNGPVQFVNEVISGYRQHSHNQGKGSQVPKMCRRVFYNAFFSAENTAEQKHIVRESWHAKQQLIVHARLENAGEHLRNGKPLKAAISFLKLPFIAFRYLRGYPTLGWL